MKKKKKKNYRCVPNTGTVLFTVFAKARKGYKTYKNETLFYDFY